MTTDSSLPGWVDDVLAVEEISRLDRVRFHGTLTIHRVSDKVSSRLEHSIAVAGLAWTLAPRLGLSGCVAEALFLASLLHDIGHLPFSHILEPLFRQHTGRYHEGETSMVIRRVLGDGGTIRRIVGDRLAGICLHFFDRSGKYPTAEELLFGPLSLDTIDGIHRACEPLCDPLLIYDPSEIVSALRPSIGGIGVACDSAHLILLFGEVKRRLYREYINSPEAKGLTAMITLAAEHAIPDRFSVSSVRNWDDTQMVDLLLANSTARFILAEIRDKRLFSPIEDVDEMTVDTQREVISAGLDLDAQLLIPMSQFDHDFPGRPPLHPQLDLTSGDESPSMSIGQYYDYLRMERTLLPVRSWYGPVRGTKVSTGGDRMLQRPVGRRPAFLWW